MNPSTSPLPRECSTTELHQHCKHRSTSNIDLTTLYPSYRERSRPSTTRKAKKPKQDPGQRPELARLHRLPGQQAPDTASTASAITMRPLPAGLRSTTAHHSQYHYNTQKNGAQGRIRTSVAHNAADLQSAAINHSATCALLLRTAIGAALRTSPPSPSPIPAANRAGYRPEGVAVRSACQNGRAVQPNPSNLLLLPAAGAG